MTIWVKLLLYRRRVAEDEKASRARADHQPRDAAESPGGISDTTAPPVFQYRQPRMVRKLPAAFDRSKPLRAFCRAAPSEALNSKNEKGESQ